jgi:hypothetical protein
VHQVHTCHSLEICQVTLTFPTDKVLIQADEKALQAWTAWGLSKVSIEAKKALAKKALDARSGSLEGSLKLLQAAAA